MSEQLIGLKEHPLMAHFKREMVANGSSPDDSGYKDLCALIELFCAQGHSDETARVCSSVFSQLATMEPISPLMGIEDEWERAGDNFTLFVNKRCGHVFRELTPQGTMHYDMRAVIFINEQDQMFLQQPASTQLIKKFPYMPNPQFVRVKSNSGNRIFVPGRTVQ